MATRYVFPIISACIFTSVSLNLHLQRREAEARDARLSAQVSALQDVLRRLRAGETVSDVELTKIRRRVGLGQNLHEGRANGIKLDVSKIGWKDVFTATVSSNDKADEIAFTEWLKGISDDSKSSQASSSTSPS